MNPPETDSAPVPTPETTPETTPEKTDAEPKPPHVSDAEPERAWAADPSPRRRPATVAAIVLVAILAGGALFISGFTLGALRSSTPGTPADEQAAFRPFWDTYRAVTEDYAGEPVDRKKLIDGAIKGMIGALDDPFSLYMTPDEYRRSLQGLSGRSEGIGARMEMRRVGGSGACTKLGGGCALVVFDVIPGAPAQKAGLRAGDAIATIDGVAVDGLTPDEALAKIRGPKGTRVTLGTIRGDGAPSDIAIVRDVVIQPEVETKTLGDGTVGYIRLAGFSDRAASDFGAAVASDVAAGRKRLLIDLRGNPGGFVTDAQKVISQFIPAGTTVFYQQDAAGGRTPTLALPDGAATGSDVQVALLVDGGSASASEIVAGALQDLGRAKLVGSTTYGKGTIQVWQQLADDNGGFRLTVARWLTPDGRWIHKKGLTPDVPMAAGGAAPAGADPVIEEGLRVLGVTSGPTGLREGGRRAL